MALKDWEKEFTDRPDMSFIYKRKDQKLTLIGRKFKDEPMWDVFVVRPQVNLTKHIFDRKFKTKSQSLKFTKTYMKKH